jgi:predicted metal-dependent hydrolase
MFKDLSPGIKISITRSITTAFEQYMNRIDWNESEMDLSAFIAEWRDYIQNQASWYEKLEADTKNSPQFHQELAEKINETIEKILTEEPTKAQMDEIENLQKEAREEYNYSCKTEAKYVIEKLKEEIKKKSSN